VQQTPYQTCQLAASGLYCLAQKYHTQLCFLGEYLYLRQHRQPWGECYFLPIAPAAELKNALDILTDHHRHTSPDAAPLLLWGLTADMLTALCTARPDLDPASFATHRDWAEYIYETRTLQHLAGKKLQPKRNAANQFRRNHPDFQYEDISPAVFSELQAFQQQQLALEQQRLRDDSRSLSWLEQENTSIARSLDGWDAMQMRGGIIRVGEQIRAFCMGSAINATTFDILFENAEHAYNGIFQVLEQEFIARNLADYRYVNREEDLGIPGLRFAKSNLRPDEMLYKFWGRI
jgi:hypothetical protein